MATRKRRADTPARPTREQAEDAIRTLLRWAGADPTREGLLDTPKRVVDAYGDWFCGYATDPREYMKRTFEEVAGYDELIVLRNIEFESHCEHHMAPIIGRAQTEAEAEYLKKYGATDVVMTFDTLADAMLAGYRRAITGT